MLMVKVRLLVSLYARGPRKGDVCRDVALHKEMPKIPSRYTWNPQCPGVLLVCHVLCSLSTYLSTSLLSSLLEVVISIVIAYDANKEEPKR